MVSPLFLAVAVLLLDRPGEGKLGELTVTERGAELGPLARVVAPRLVAGEQVPSMPPLRGGDLCGQPARREADRPGQVRVDPLAGLDPVEEPGAGELDVPA